MIWHLSLILEGSEEEAPVEEAGNSSVSEGGREHNLRIEGVLPTFQVSPELSPWGGVPAYMHQWSPLCMVEAFHLVFINNQCLPTFPFFSPILPSPTFQCLQGIP